MNLPGVIILQKAYFIPPDGREVSWGAVQSPPLARGALACASTTTALTIPGTGGAVTIRRRFPCEIATGGTPACEIVRGHCPLR